MSDDVKVFSIVLAVIAILIITVGVVNYRETIAIEKAISEGADPLEVRCAYDEVLYCSTLASK